MTLSLTCMQWSSLFFPSVFHTHLIGWWVFFEWFLRGRWDLREEGSQSLDVTQTLKWKKLQKMRDVRGLLGKRDCWCVFGGFEPFKPPFHPHSPLDSVSMLASLKSAMPVISLGLPLAFYPHLFPILRALWSWHGCGRPTFYFRNICGISQTFHVWPDFNGPVKSKRVSFLSTPFNCACRYAYVCMWNLSPE